MEEILSRQRPPEVPFPKHFHSMPTGLAGGPYWPSSIAQHWQAALTAGSCSLSAFQLPVMNLAY